MNKFNETLQLLASVGVLIGLIVVAYELRQNKAFAEAQYNATTYGMWMQATAMEMETNIGEIFIKSIEDPGNLSKSEKFKLNSYFTHIITIYDHGDRAREIGVGSAVSGVISEAEVRNFLSSDYARQWFEGNRYWMRPGVAESIARAMEETPTPTEWIPIQNQSAPSIFE